MHTFAYYTRLYSSNRIQLIRIKVIHSLMLGVCCTAHALIIKRLQLGFSQQHEVDHMVSQLD